MFWVNGIQFGRNMQVYNKVYLQGQGKVIIGDNFVYTSGNNINSVSRNIKGAIHTMSENATIVIGNNVGISSSCLRSMSGITIGDNVQIGADCLIMDNDAHPLEYKLRRRSYELSVERYIFISKINKAPILIDNDVWVGARCIILKGVHIGARSIIAAGSVVTKNIPSDVVAGGNPCKIIRSLT